jgi:glycosyltransferase involved in cell wall biosynthesis
MRIVIVSQYFPPDKPGRIVDELSAELARRGHSVRVLTTFPHYRTGRTEAGYRQRWRHIEEYGQVSVRRVPIYASHSRNALGRIANYLSFAWSSRLATSFVAGADAVYVHGTPASAAYGPRIWSRSLGIPFLYHVQDIWPESVTGSGFLPGAIAALADRLISKWLRKVYSAAGAVVAIAPGARDLLVQRGAAASRVHLVYNWARDVSRLPDPEEGERPSGLTLLYAGNLGVLQDLETVLRAVGRTTDLEDLRLLVAGAGVMEDHLKNLCLELGIQRSVNFLGQLAPDRVSEFYTSSDFQIVPLKRLEIFAHTIPSKFQAGLSHGLPVITTVTGDLTRLVAENGLGFTAGPEDVESLAEAIRAAHATTRRERQELRDNAQIFYETNFTKAHAIDRIEQILEAIRK